VRRHWLGRSLWIRESAVCYNALVGALPEVEPRSTFLLDLARNKGGIPMDRPGLDQDHPLRVFVLTDQRLIAEMVKLTLNHGVYVTRHARDVDDARTILAEWHPQLAIIDMDAGGDRVVRQIGKDPQGKRTRIPILALTRRGDLRTKMAAFDLGVDDIMTIPISPEELLARVLVITQRSIGRTVPLNPVIKVGEIEIDILNRQVRAGTSELHLTGLEQSLLYLLAANAGQIVSRDEILDALWGVDFVSESNVVDRHIRTLRIKLQDNWRKPRYIATVPGQGYRFVPTHTDQPASGGRPGSISRD
jgi:two-component system, OmpR family, KDP operon response regulator KdpE